MNWRSTRSLVGLSLVAMFGVGDSPPSLGVTFPSTRVLHAASGAKVPPRVQATKNRSSPPPGADVMRFENIEGLILVSATLSGVRDTSGLLVLDTGSGYLALDHLVADRLGLLEDVFVEGSVDFADRALARLKLGATEIDQVSPVLVLDASVVRRVTDRDVLGLLGERAMRGRSVFIDYRAERVTFIPPAPGDPREPAENAIGARPSGDTASSSAKAEREPDSIADVEPAILARSRASFGALLTSRASPIAFRLVGDGKMMVNARIRDPKTPESIESVRLILDTGATKCVLFAEAWEARAAWKAWPSLTGLSAPTLLGNSEARIVRVPEIDLGSSGVIRRQVDAVVIRSPLSEALTRVVGSRVDGLLGHSFLRRYRVGIDYPRRIVWLDPVPEPWDDRPYEYSHIGLQIERNGAAAEVVAVAENSPAARAGIAVGDTVVAIDGANGRDTDLAALAKRLEGPPGSRVRVAVGNSGAIRRYVLVRRRLL